MLRGLRSRVARAFTEKPPPTPEQAHLVTAKSQQERAGTIGDLSSEIRRLQQEIKDVSDALASGLTGDARTAHEGTLASLHRQLDETQRDLAKLQARI
jgi:uncharacterized protein YukE